MGRGLPKLENFPMEGLGAQALTTQCVGQGSPPSRRAAEPDGAVGLERGGDFLRRERAGVVGQAAVQADAGGVAEGFQLVGKAAGSGVWRAVEKISRGFRGRRGGRQLLKAGEEGRDADAAGDPDLMLSVSTVNRNFWRKIKCTIWAFEGDCLAGLDQHREPVREVAERFDDQGQRAILRVPGRGDGEGMGAFAALAEVGKEKLSGAVARPAGLWATDDFEQLAVVLADRNDLGTMLAVAPDAIGQREQGRDNAGSGKRGGQPAERALPESRRHQDQAVEGTGQEDGAKGLVHPAEIAVGNPFDQCDDNQSEQNVAGPFTDLLGQFDPHVGLAARSARAIRAGDQASLGQVLG